ncbi:MULTISPECIES: CHAT domain-containing protein [unclassified Microcoleus]|uniref:CHAT domain-containing protein n=1 Tax=unclassified Microcoleus TaxID=2642155 RepID=UPI002FD11FFD
MVKVVVLKIGNGDFERGFPVSLQIGEDGFHPFTEPRGQLPPAPDIVTHYTCWQSSYRRIVDPFGVRLGAEEGQPTNPQELNKQNATASEQLGGSLNKWLKSGEFSSIREKLKQVLKTDEEVRFIVETDDIRLQRLPWHLWDFWEQYHQSELALCLPEYNPISRIPTTTIKEQVRILVVFGELSNNNFLKMNTEADWEILTAHFPDADMIRLDQPKLEDLGNLLWQEQLDIILYSGHSSSQADGLKSWLVINEQENIEMRDLKYAFQKVVRRGLQLAIFNSCDGLGIGRQLADWHIPQVIVMREPVPDYVAQKFLQYFLEAYAREGKSLYLAVRVARERLSFLKYQCPSATWLPVIFHNPAERLLSWQEICSVSTNSKSQNSSSSAIDSEITNQVAEQRSPTDISIVDDTQVVAPTGLLAVFASIVPGCYKVIQNLSKTGSKLMLKILEQVKRFFGNTRVDKNEEEVPNFESDRGQKIKVTSLQQEIDSQPDNATLTLRPRGFEYEGPLVINRPIILDGQGATISVIKGPVVSIQSDRVSLGNLRIEVTGEEDSSNPEENCAILVKSGQNLQFDNVEVRGTVMGLLAEEGEWKYPNPLYLGQLAHGSEHDLLLRIVVPLACKIVSDVSGLEFEPRNLTPGPNEIRLHIEKLPKNTLIDGSIFLVSPSLKRRIALTAHILYLPNSQILPIPNIVWEPEDWSTFVAGQLPQSFEPEPIMVVSQPLIPTLPSADIRVPPTYPEPEEKVQSSQPSDPQRPKIRWGDRPNPEIFKSPEQSGASVDIDRDVIDTPSFEKPQISDIFIQNQKNIESQPFSSESPSISQPTSPSSRRVRSQPINPIFNSTPTSSVPLEKPGSDSAESVEG